MAEDYVVAGVFEWKTNLPEILKQTMRGFEDIDRQISLTKTNLTGFVTELKELTSSSRGIGALVKQFEKLRLPAGVVTEMQNMVGTARDLADATLRMATEARESATAWKEMAAASRQMWMPGTPGGVGGGRHGGGHASALDAAMGAQMGGDVGMGLFEQGFHAYADVQLQQTMAQADKRVTDAVMGRANALVAALQKQYPALTQAEGLTLFRNSMGIFGNADESLAALPGAVRLQQLYQLAPLGRGGSGGSEVQAAEKAGDALQSFIDPKTHKLDTGLYNQWMDFQARSYQAGGGLVDAKNWLSFARTARVAGIGLSPRAMEETQALLEMSPGRTGTALMSAFQVFGASTSHMTDKNRAAWNKAGLLGKDGDIIDRGLYQKDPYEWVWKDMLPKLAAQGIKDRDQILRWLTDHGQRSTVAGILADIAIGQTPITNTATKMENQDPNLVDKLTQTDVGKLAALHAAENNFFVALGKFGEGPGIALLTSLTKGLNSLTDWANAHPQAATRLIMMGGGLALLSKIAGDSAMAALFIGGPLVRGVGGLASALIPFAAGGRASAALAGLSAAGGGSLFGLAAGIIALGAAMLALPPLLKWLVSPDDPTKRFVPNPGGGGRGGHWETDWAHLDPSKRTWGTGPGPAHDFQGWAQKFWNGPSAAPGTNSRGGRPVQHSSYSPTVNVPIIINLDGKTIYQNTVKRIVDGLSSHGGPTGGDPRSVPQPPGAVGQLI